MTHRGPFQSLPFCDFVIQFCPQAFSQNLKGEKCRTERSPPVSHSLYKSGAGLGGSDEKDGRVVGSALPKLSSKEQDSAVWQ